MRQTLGVLILILAIGFYCGQRPHKSTDPSQERPAQQYVQSAYCEAIVVSLPKRDPCRQQVNSEEENENNQNVPDTKSTHETSPKFICLSALSHDSRSRAIGRKNIFLYVGLLA
jgi:hypothetical protein